MTLKIEGDILNSGDEVSLRSSEGLIIGAGVVDNGAVVISAWADDFTTEDIVEGAKADEAISLAFWSLSKEEEIRLQITEGLNILTGDEVGSELTFNNDSFFSLEVEKAPEIPTEFTLMQNYPNPFNPSTMIRFGLPDAGTVKITVYNILGAQVAVLVNDYKLAGYHQVLFNDPNLASGLYFYRMEATGWSNVRKMMILK